MGVVLSVLTVATGLSTLDVFRGGVGDRNFAPTSAADLEEEYVLGIGDMELDLSGTRCLRGDIERQGERGYGSVAGAGTRRCQCRSHRFGGARPGQMLGEDQGGFGPRLETRIDVPGSAVTIELEASVGMGEVEVSS